MEFHRRNFFFTATGLVEHLRRNQVSFEHLQLTPCHATRDGEEFFMAGEITPIADFGEATMDAEEDCWLLLSDLTEKVLARSMPPDRRRSPGRVIYAAFPGRGREPRGSGG